MAKGSAVERRRAQELLSRYGRTYADEAGIRLTDKPSPLYRLLVLATLLSARISADIAVAAAQELSRAGYRTPRRMLQASRQDRVDALGRGHYRRYDERTATMLGDGAQLCLDRWNGDLRRLHAEADTPDQMRQLLQKFPGIGPTGADIFLREVQSVWTDVRPDLDTRVLKAAARVELPDETIHLARLVKAHDLARLGAAILRAQ